jgi:small subunit ribosomal protein S1
MSEQFSTLLESHVQHLDNVKAGAIMPARVIYIDKHAVVLDAGLKSDAVVDIAEFKDAHGELNVAIDDMVDVVVESVADGLGETRLSREKAKRIRAWLDLEVASQERTTVEGLVVERVKGGFTVDVSSLKAFLPGSLADIRPVRDPALLEGKVLSFKVIKMDKSRNNIVVSRKAVLEEEMGAERQQLIENLSEGQEVKGIVKNITDYGAFVDLGGIDGLLHITDMAWKRVKNPGELFSVGDEIDVKILKYDAEKRRVSLGIKQLGEDPWEHIADNYPVGARVKGKVTNVTDYGCFVEVEDCIEGLVHMSELDWTNKNIHPGKVVSVGQEVTVCVLDVDPSRRRISLGLKQCQANPWQEFCEQNKKGDIVTGEIRSTTDFGIFIGLPGGIDGLVHVSDISWSESGEKALSQYQKGDPIKAMVLSVDSERERISLGIKQLESSPVQGYLDNHPKGSEVAAQVVEIQPKKGVLVELEQGIQGFIKIGDISSDHVENIEDYVQMGEELDAKIVGVDGRTQFVMLSLKELEDHAGQGQSDAVPQATLGDIMKEQMERKS